MTSIDIKKVQQALINAGYSVGKTGADGIFGRDTIKGLKAFQSAMGLDIQYPGTIGPKTLRALGLIDDSTPIQNTIITPPWITEGLRKLGLHEKADNKKLREYLKSDGQTLGDPAQLPWCGDFIETIIALTLPKESLPTNPYWAANWLKFGKSLPIDEFYKGAIGVKKREGGNHVFTIVGHDKLNVHALGGNQSNSISIVKIPKKQITGMRWPNTYPMPLAEMPYTDFNGKMAGSEA